MSDTFIEKTLQDLFPNLQLWLTAQEKTLYFALRLRGFLLKNPTNSNF